MTGLLLSTSGTVFSILMGIAVIISLVGALAVQIVFLAQKNEGKFTGFVGWVYEFLHFRKMLLETILRLAYIFSAIFLVVGGFVSLFVSRGNIFQNILAFLLVATVGNVILRLVYELLMMGIVLCRNVADINRKMGAGLQNSGSQPTAPATVIQQSPPQAPKAPAQPPKAPQTPPQQPKTTAAPGASGPVFQPGQQPGALAKSAANPVTQTPQPQGIPQGGAKAVVFCRKCGQQFDGSLSACPNCGTPRS